MNSTNSYATGSAALGIIPAGGANSTAGSVADVTQDPSNESEYPELGDNSSLTNLFVAVPSSHFTIGLYTHSDGSYRVIKIQSGKIYAATLTTTSAGVELLKKYGESYGSIPSERSGSIGSSVTQNKHEAYALGQTVSSLGAWVEIGVYRTHGSTYQYGWNFNWNGNKS